MPKEAPQSSIYHLVEPISISESLKTFTVDPGKSENVWMLNYDKSKISVHHGFDFVLTLMMGMKGKGLIDDATTQQIIDRMFDNDKFHNFSDGAKQSRKHITEAKKNLEDILDDQGLNSIDLKNLTRHRDYGGLQWRMKEELEDDNPIAVAVEDAFVLLVPELFEDPKQYTGSVTRVEVVSLFPLPTPLDGDDITTNGKFRLGYAPDTLAGIHYKGSLKRIANITEQGQGVAIAIRSKEDLHTQI